MLKALRDIGFEDYYQAEQTGWVLYLEGETDLSILRAFAEKLGHEARTHLDRYFEKLGLPNQMRKTNYHVLARFVRSEQIDAEVSEKLDAILAVARQARAAGLP